MKKLVCALLAMIMLLGLTACGEKEASSVDDTEEVVSETVVEEPEEDIDEEVVEEPDVEEETADLEDEIEEEAAMVEEELETETEIEVAETEPTETTTSSEEMVDGMRVSFKEAMDSYEAFYDEYVEFMKKYKESSDTTSMLDDYMDILNQANEFNSKMAEWDDGNMNDAELKYYLEVTSRVTQKLAEVA